MTLPLITIAMPCFNAEATIGRALESALAQDWPALEILVVDDASTDNSVAVVERLAATHPAIRLVRRRENGGVGAARQTLLEEARGEFLCFFDDDDESLPPRVRRQYEALTAYERGSGASLVSCYASGKRIYPNGIVRPFAAIGAHPIVPVGEDVAAYLLFFRKRTGWFYGSGTPTGRLMARRDVILSAGGFDPALRRVEDLDLAIRLALLGGHFIGIPDELTLVHVTAGDDKTLEKNRDAEIALAEKHATWLETVGMRDYARKWPWVRYHHFRGDHGAMLAALLALALRQPVKTLRHIVESGWRRLRYESAIK